MPTEAASSDTEDPLQGYSYLSLFPRTCRSLGVVVNPTELGDLDSVHNVLKTVGLKKTTKHIEQVKMIVESSTEDMQSEVNVNAAVQKESEAMGVVNDKIGRKRRPGLGRMQAKFNFNHRVSQPAVIKEPTLDITKLKDPDEFFLAHERLEHAKKELRKQSGILSEIDVGMSLTARPRRPGIPGRSKATYKHHCYSVVSNDDVLKEPTVEKADKGLKSSLSPMPGSFLLSQENSKENHRSPFNENTLPEVNVPIEDGVLGGSISEVNGFLDEILLGTYDHLTSEGQLTLLQEQLQLKPINIDNLSLPKLPVIPKYDFKMSKPRKTLLDIQAAISGMNNIKPVKSVLTPGRVHFSASPTPPKSPFANLCSLKKHILQLNRSEDLFSEFNTDPCSEGGSSPVSGADKPDLVDLQEYSSSKLKVLSDDKDISALSDKSLHPELIQESGGLPDPVDDVSTVVARASSIPSDKSGDQNGVTDKTHKTTEYYNGSPINDHSDVMMQSGNATVALNSSEPDPCVVDQHSVPTGGLHDKLLSTNSNQCSAHQEDIHVEGDANRSTNKKMRRKTVPVHRTTIVRRRRDGIAADDTDAQEQVPSRAEVQAEHISALNISMQRESSIDNSRFRGVELHEKQSKLPDTGFAAEKVQKVHETSVNQKRKGKSIPIQEHDLRAEATKKQKRKGDQRTSAEQHVNQSKMPNNHPPQQQEELMVPNASLNEKSRKTAKRKKELSLLRKSIAVAGTSYKAGVRTSNRHKSRPLEFWRGERYLYARLEPDSTLPTLIGVKRYATPDKKEGKAAAMKVEDKVDGKKYRELIDQAALH